MVKGAHHFFITICAAGVSGEMEIIMLIGALEAGGTKMVCAVGNKYGNIFDMTTFPTKDPSVTIPCIVDYFKKEGIDCLGIGCFGPIDLDSRSLTYGYITSTPKLAWKNYDMVGNMRKAMDIPIGFDTDVNGAVLGEVTFGAAKGLDFVIYITIGTGVGVGVYQNGQLMHGMMHPEAGHILMKKREDDTYHGKCPYHKTCFEGLAAGPAIEERWGARAAKLKERSEVWDLEAYYIAQALTNYIYVYSPQKIILGGGVMNQEQLFLLIRNKVIELNAGYVSCKGLQDMDHYIVPASLHDKQGILGALELGRRAFQE
jgi:fructokinase